MDKLVEFLYLISVTYSPASACKLLHLCLLLRYRFGVWPGFIPFGLSTLLFSAFTSSPSFSSINRVTLFITRSAACLLPTSMIRSSAYRTKSIPLASSSLSSSFNMIFANSGEIFPPCGLAAVYISVPAAVP